MKKIMQGLCAKAAAALMLASTCSLLLAQNSMDQADIVGGQVVGANPELSLNPDTRIVGGTDVSVARPWMVSLQLATSGHFCGGSLIHPDWVLTAAHCVEDIADPNSLFLIIGGLTSMTANEDAEVRRGEYIYNHPFYDSKIILHDIALIKLNQASTKTPIKIANGALNSQLTPGLLLKVMGWGVTEDGGNRIPNQLLEVNLSYQHDNSCRAIHGQSQYYWNHFLCVGESAGGVDACSGDSGGPLVTNLGDEWAQVGLVSWGAGCALPNAFGAYSEIAAYTEWIDQVMQGATLFGERYIGFIGKDIGSNKHPKSARVKVSNFSESDITINTQTIQKTATNDTAATEFEFNSAAQLSSLTLSPNQVCDFGVDALGAEVGEHDAVVQFTTTAGEVLQHSVNAKVLPDIGAVSAALDNQWIWFNGHDHAWQIVTPVEGDTFLRSGSIDNNQRSVLLTYLNFPESGGYLVFDRKTSTEFDRDSLIVAVDEITHYEANGERDWKSVVLGPFSGTRHVLFVYVKDEAQTSGDDAVYINNVRLCANADRTNCSTSLSDYVASVEPDNTPSSCVITTRQTGGAQYAVGTPQSFAPNPGSTSGQDFLSRSKDKGAAFFWLLLTLPILVGAKKPRLNR